MKILGHTSGNNDLLRAQIQGSWNNSKFGSIEATGSLTRRCEKLGGLGNLAGKSLL